jgi:elongation factor Tu
MTEKFACPSCGAPLEYDGSGYASMRCPFCSSSVVVPEALRVVRRPAAAAQQVPPSPAPSAGAGFRMTVDDVFSIKGRGTVATGQIQSGTVRVGDRVRITRASGGGAKTTTVSGVEMFRKVLAEARAGDNVGLLLKEVAKNDLQRGDVLESD